MFCKKKNPLEGIKWRNRGVLDIIFIMERKKKRKKYCNLFCFHCITTTQWWYCYWVYFMQTFLYGFTSPYRRCKFVCQSLQSLNAIVSKSCRYSKWISSPPQPLNLGNIGVKVVKLQPSIFFSKENFQIKSLFFLSPSTNRLLEKTLDHFPPSNFYS